MRHFLRLPGCVMMGRDSKEKHPLQIWSSLGPGIMVSLAGWDEQKYVGTVETRTGNGLIIWIRTDLNERKMFHFHEVKTVYIIDDS